MKLLTTRWTAISNWVLISGQWYEFQMYFWVACVIILKRTVTLKWRWHGCDICCCPTYAQWRTLSLSILPIIPIITYNSNYIADIAGITVKNCYRQICFLTDVQCLLHDIFLEHGKLKSRFNAEHRHTQL